MKERRTRAPDETRRRILEAAFQEFHLNGFQAARVDAILHRAGATKGALYHHFPDKTTLGYAVLEEIIHTPLLEAYIDGLGDAHTDPVDSLQAVLRRRADDFESGGIELGCPLNNLTQEMSPLDEGFRVRLAATLDSWTDAFAAAIERGQRTGRVRTDVDARAVARLLVAAIEGSFGMAKNARSVELLRSNLTTLAGFLDTLRLRAA
ncbi:MAG TPA: TetR/AcrR family transcriptional regulator [Longimicrobiales bacterium]|nr:TetR/AcrR family transcriptional regulator [Longimicrobiales bacterium]